MIITIHIFGGEITDISSSTKTLIPTDQGIVNARVGGS